ncbi:hypothetical protein QFZ98_003813 [Paraburkholderia youngii]
MQHDGMLRDPIQPDRGKRQKPHGHHGTECTPDHRAATSLKRKERDQDGCRDRHDPWIERWTDLAQSLDGRQHGYGRRYHRIAIEHRGAKESREQQRTWHPPPFVLIARSDQRRQCDDAAFAFIVGGQHVPRVLEYDDDDDGPHDHRQRAHHDLHVDRTGFDGGLAQRVDGTRADVAEYDTQCG